MAAHNVISPYMVGVLDTAAQSKRAAKAQKASAHVTDAATAAPAPAKTKHAARRRRRNAPTRTDRGYRYEFLDLVAESDDLSSSDVAGQANSAKASHQSTGLAGATATLTKQRAAGLSRPASDAYSETPTAPLMPSNWRLNQD